MLSLKQKFRCKWEPEIYISLGKVSTSCHTLAIETGRHGQSQLCLFCKNNLDITVIEDECHFLISCPAYTNIRNHYIKHILDKCYVNN